MRKILWKTFLNETNSVPLACKSCVTLPVSGTNPQERLRRSDLIHYHEIVDGSGAITVQDQHGMRDRRFVGGIVEAGDAARSGLGFANKVRGGGALGGDHNGASAQRFATS